MFKNKQIDFEDAFFNDRYWYGLWVVSMIGFIISVFKDSHSPYDIWFNMVLFFVFIWIIAFLFLVHSIQRSRSGGSVVFLTFILFFITMLNFGTLSDLFYSKPQIKNSIAKPKPIVTPSPSPSPTKTVQQRPANPPAAKKIDCVGPYGMHSSLTREQCNQLNSEWAATEQAVRERVQANYPTQNNTQPVTITAPSSNPPSTYNYVMPDYPEYEPAPQPAEIEYVPSEWEEHFGEKPPVKKECYEIGASGTYICK